MYVCEHTHTYTHTLHTRVHVQACASWSARDAPLPWRDQVSGARVRRRVQ